MENKKLLPLIIKMSIPPALSMLIQSLYNIIDSIYITNYDQKAMEAISLVYPIQNIILAIAVGIGIGINAYVSMKLGEKKPKEAANAATLGIILSCLHYLIVLIAGLAVSGIFIRSFTKDETVIEYGLTYINLMIVFSFTTIIQIAMEKILQADGKMLLPMISLLVGTITNVILDPLLIFNAQMGILGAAIATVAGQVLATIVMTYFVFSKRNSIRLSFRGFKVDKASLAAIYKVGIPSIFINAIPSIMVSAMNYILVGVNDTAVTTFGIYYKLQYFVYMGVSGISQGTMPIMGYCFGAKNQKRLNQTIKDSVLLSFGIGVASMILFLSIPNLLMAMFYKDSALIESTNNLLRIASVSFMFGCVSYILASYFQAVQKGFLSFIITMLRQLILLLPIAYALQLGLNEFGIYLALPISEALALGVAAILFLHTKKRLSQSLT